MEYDEALLSNLTVPELQQECKKRGLKKSGIKIKLIQRLAEHIEKYGPEACVPPAPPPEVPVVEKSVNAIHNPHPYMAEYEEQLIEGANMEDDIDDYYSTKDEMNVESSSGDRRKVEHNNKTETSVNEEVPDPSSEPPSPEIPQPVQSPVRDPREQEDVREFVEEGNFKDPGESQDDVERSYGDERNYEDAEKYENVRDQNEDDRNDGNDDTEKDRDHQDMAEELTEPIHKSPSSQEDHNDRIVQLPVNNHDDHQDLEEDEHEGRAVVNYDQVDNAENENSEMEDHKNHEFGDVENGQDEEQEIEHDETYEDSEEKVHVKDSTAEEEQMDEHFAEDNESHQRDDREDEDEEEGMEVVQLADVKEALHSEDVEDAEESEVLDYADGDETTGMQYTESNEGEAENDAENHDIENIAAEHVADLRDEREDTSMEEVNEEDKEAEESEASKSAEIHNEEEVQHESSVEEEGEITANSEQQNDEGNVVGDDHLDVSIQDDKIAEDSEPEEPIGTPKPPKKTVVPVSLKKRVSLVASTETQEEKAARRKRRWGATNTLMKDSSIPISSESIKKLIPDMKIDAAALESVPELDYQEDDTVEETMEIRQPSEDVEVITGTPPKVTKVGRTVKVDTAKKITLNKSTSQEVVTVESDSGEPSKSNPPLVVPQPVRTYVVDDEVEIQEQREKSPSPAKNPISQYIYIENLVRPYTINQLKSVIRRSGEIVEGGFWINNIKSRCYVKFTSEEQATATRDALHGLRWPAGSPKVLKVDYAVNEQMYGETEGLLGEKPKIVIEIDDKENDPIIISQERSSMESRRERKDSERSKSRSDRKKKATKETEKVKGKEKKDDEREESPAKLLDDLFRKTKATPCIYWLPLTEEQVLEREKQAELNRTNEPHNERSYDSRDRMEHSNDRYSDRRSQQFRGSNRSWR